MAVKPRQKNPTPERAMESTLEQLLLANDKVFLKAAANVLEKHCSNLDVENYDEIDDAVHALRFSLQPYEVELHTGESDD